VGVTVGGFYFDHAFADFQNRDIECAAAEVVYGDGFILFLVKPIGQCSCRRLVDDALYFETGNLAGVLRCLTLGVIKVGRHGDDRFGNLFAEIVFRCLLQLLQDHCRHLGRGVLLALGQHCHVVTRLHHFVRHHLDFFGHLVITATHESLDRVNRVLRVGDGLALCHLPHQPLAGLGKADD